MINTIDYIIIIIYLAFIMIIGFISGKSNKNQKDFLLAGKSMPWLPIAFSVAATMISANTFIGAPGWAYTEGIAPYMTNIMVPFAVFFALFITIPIFYNMNVTSIYEYINSRFGKFTRFLTVIQFFINSIIQVSSMVFIPALILNAMLGISLNVIVPIVVLVSIIYTIMGGIRAVIWTDFIQMIIVFLSSTIVIYTALSLMNVSIFDSISTAKSVGDFKAFDFSFNLSTPTAFYVATIGGLFMWVRYFSFDQVQVQRVLTAKDLKATKRSLCLSSFLMNAIFLVMLIAGVFLKQLYGGKEFDSSNQVMIEFILTKLPIGIVGLAIAGTLASAMSSVDSLLNSLTTVFIKDIYEPYFKKTDEETSLKTTVIIACLFGVLIIFFVIIGFSNSVGSVIEVVGKYISYFSGPACSVFLLGLFTKKTSDKGAAIGFVVALITVIVFSSTYNIAWILNPAIGAIVGCIVGYLSSILIFKSKNEEAVIEYTAYGINYKDDSLKPFRFDKYSAITLSIFFGQFIILILLAK